MADFRKLRVWRHAHAMSLNVDKAARKIRPADYASLRRQLIKTGLSISANIVEGREKSSEAEFAKHLEIAKGSASELEQHLIAARDLAVMSESDFHSLTKQMKNVRKMLIGLLRRLRKSIEDAENSKKKRRSKDHSDSG